MLLTLEKDFFSTLSSSSSLSNPTSRILCSLPSSSPDGINPKHKERCCNAFVGKRALPETTIGQYPPSLHCFPKPSSLLVPNSLSFLDFPPSSFYLSQDPGNTVGGTQFTLTTFPSCTLTSFASQHMVCLFVQIFSGTLRKYLGKHSQHLE